MAKRRQFIPIIRLDGESIGIEPFEQPSYMEDRNTEFEQVESKQSIRYKDDHHKKIPNRKLIL